MLKEMLLENRRQSGENFCGNSQKKLIENEEKCVEGLAGSRERSAIDFRWARVLFFLGTTILLLVRF